MIGFMMIVGPGEGLIAADGVRTILNLYPQARLWLTDDATSDGSYEALLEAAAGSPHVVIRRNRAALGLKGLPVSIFRTLEYIAETCPDIEMLIKLDPDVCILRPGLVEFARSKFKDEGPGILGSYRYSPAGGVRSHVTHTINMLRDLLPIGIDRQTRRLRAGFPFYLSSLSRALRNGYRLGHHVLGAFYIVDGGTLRAVRNVGFWRAIPDAGSRDVKNDDPLLSLGAYVVGHKLIDIHGGPSPRVWIQYLGPLPRTAAEFCSQGYLAVHPLKQNAAGLVFRGELRCILSQSYHVN